MIIETNGDIKLVGRAIRERWPVSIENRKELIERLMEILNDPESRPREKTAVAKALKAADSINQKQKQKEDLEPYSGPNRFLAIADRLGIGDRQRGIEQEKTAPRR